jgi:PEP-CTERM/exosortase A-associated glycosyltransferase
MSLRILHVLDHSVPLQSGYAFRTLSILREQRALGWETFQLTTPKHYAPGPMEEDVAGFHFFRSRVRPAVIGRAPVLNQAAVIQATAQRLEELLPLLRPDIVHAHSPALNGIAALRGARKFSIPVVYELRASWEDAAVDHGSTREGSLRYRLSRMLESSVLRRADAVTTICEGLATEIRSRGIPAPRVTVIPNAVDIDDFEVIEQTDFGLREKLALGTGPVLGFVGSLYGYEGLELLLRALPRIAETHAGVRVLLVGGGPAEASLKDLAAALGVTDRVSFIGRVPHEDVRRHYSVIDLLVYPRLSIRLTELVTPLKPLEAMSLGRMFIASDVGGHRELVPQMLQPYLFEPGDPEELARAATALLAERDRWPILTAAARRYVAEQRTWRSSVARYAAVYARCAPRRAAS